MTEAEKRELAGRTPASESDGNEEFPAGMRVLAVDDDPICLKMLENLLRKCRYKVTVTPQAAIALKLLRESKDKFDIVISDVHMPDMDGFKLLETVGLEMDLPVIMMSANSDVSTVMKGIKHGARDYLLKPIRIEQLKNIWQHVIRKTLLQSREGSDSTDKDKCGTKRMSIRASKATRKSRDQIVIDNEADDFSVEDPTSQKKQRVTWSRDLHKQFISAVEQLGIENAVPKRILDIMNHPGLTRENIASHLQKYRKALKLNCVGMNCSSISSDYINSNPPTTGLETFDKLHTKSVNCLKGFQIDGYNSNSGVSWFNNSQNPGIFGVSHGNTKSLPCLPNPQDGLLQHYAKAPEEAGQLFHALPNTGLADALVDTENYLSISPVTEQLDTFTGLPSYSPGFDVFSRSETNRNCLLEYEPSGHSLGMTFGATESSCLEVRDGTANNHGAIAPLGLVQNSLPGPHVSKFQPRVNADFGTSLELKSNSMDLATGRGHLKPIEDPDPALNLGIDDMFLGCNDDSFEDLGAVVRQFHRWGNSSSTGL